ncbi:MAG: DUF2007 domain-containing protein [bacterium]|nr:DUF2007 domain-containing protein [bacterium]
MIQWATPQPGRFVKVATVGDITAGNVLAARLRSEGIEVRVHSQAFGPYPMTVGDFAEAELWVLTDRVEDASAILLDAEVNDAIASADPDIDHMMSGRPMDLQIISLVLGAIMVGLFVFVILRVY